MSTRAAVRIRARRRLAGVAVAVAASVALVACQGTASTGENATDGPMPTLRVAYAQGIQVNFYYALQNGLFEENGVKVEGTRFASGPELIAALTAGSADVGYFGAPAMVTANAAGADLQVFGIANEAGKMAALYVNPESGIASVGDLEGKTVATTQNTVTHIYLLIALERAGIDPADVNIVFLEPSALVAGYIRGDIDVVYMFAAVGAKLIAAGATLIESSSSSALGLDDTGNFVADATFIRDNVGTLRKFLAAVDQGTSITNGNKEASLEALEKGVGLVGEQAEIIYENMPSPGLTSKQLADPEFRLSLTPNGGFSSITQTLVDAMVDLGIVKEAPDVPSFITAEVVGGME